MRHIKQSWHVLLSMLHVKGKMGKDMDERRQREALLHAYRQMSAETAEVLPLPGISKSQFGSFGH